ncbi:MAG: pyridoxamine 5'-phosphate oxidase family protein [Candidatus Cohnella colombiensis]|uniref:Pyridoxamine 5'-phosphate oxidase family protein n=1 Tax=Candidatus Cohnella colombiensis TaxID=3121368 RepID=A0AA95JFP5_9BACL|nr:MAG: pyridoxamine 5'-phosphate oxidase family protein [Cohnella sp.]
MFTVRLAKLECTDQDKINAFLMRAQTGFLGLSSADQPYVVPLNFTWWNGAIYVHGAEEGRKVSYIRGNPQACFTVSEANGTMTSPVPAHTDTAYMSVMLFGEVTFVEDLEEATGAMQRMLDKYVPGYYDQRLASSHVDKYRSSLGSRTLILKLIPTAITAKENARDESRMFQQ